MPIAHRRQNKSANEFSETLWLIRQLREDARKLGYELDLEDAHIIADQILERAKVGDGIIKV